MYTESLTEEKYLWMALARRMARGISHRGPDDRGAHVSEHCALAHVRLALQDPENGLQPMTVHQGGCAAIAYDGELWNSGAPPGIGGAVLPFPYEQRHRSCTQSLSLLWRGLRPQALRQLRLCGGRFPAAASPFSAGTVSAEKFSCFTAFQTTGWPLPRNSRDFSNIPVWPRRWEEKGSVKCWGWTPSALRAALSLSTFRR